MTSTASTRLWRICKEAGRPFPQLTDDDVLDFMVMEAVTIKVHAEDAAEQKKNERAAWKKDTSHLKGIVGKQ